MRVRAADTLAVAAGIIRWPRTLNFLGGPLRKQLQHATSSQGHKIVAALLKKIKSLYSNEVHLLLQYVSTYS